MSWFQRLRSGSASKRKSGVCCFQVLMWQFSGLGLYQVTDGDPFAARVVSLWRSLFSSLWSAAPTPEVSSALLHGRAVMLCGSPSHQPFLECCPQVPDSTMYFFCSFTLRNQPHVLACPGEHSRGSASYIQPSKACHSSMEGLILYPGLSYFLCPECWD